MRVLVLVTRRPGIADPEAATVGRALRDLGHEVGDVRFGRTITLELDEPDPDQAAAKAREMCEQLLANPVIEDYEVRVLDEAPAQ